MDNFLTSSTLLLYTQLMLKYVTNSVYYVRAEKEPIGTFRFGVGLQGNPDKKRTSLLNLFNFLNGYVTFGCRCVMIIRAVWKTVM